MFRKYLEDRIPDSTQVPNINNAALAAQDLKIGTIVIEGYVKAFQLGFRILAGIAVFKFVMCLGLKEVVLNDGKMKTSRTSEVVEVKDTKTNVEVAGPTSV